MKKRILAFLCMTLIFSSLTGFNVFAKSLSDGTYNAKVKTSYADPDTGKTVDGGTNIALGDSMCKSIVEPTMLIEQSNGKTYVTVGLGLMSNVSNVRFKVQGKDGKYRDVKAQKTGSCYRNHDTCNHYRFEVTSAEKYISPILYVTPMGRDVQFFIMPQTNTIATGTGDFGKSTAPDTNKPDTTPTPTPGSGNSSNNNSTPNNTQTPNKNNTPNTPNTPNNTPAPNGSNSQNSNASNSQAVIDNVQASEPVNSENTSDVNAVDPSQDTASAEDNAQETSSEEISEENEKSNTVWWIIGSVVVLIAIGGACWYFFYYKKKQG